MSAHFQHKMQWQMQQVAYTKDETMNQSQGPQKAILSDLSKGIGLALLSKVLGIDEISTKFDELLEKIKRSKNLKNLEMRL